MEALPCRQPRLFSNWWLPGKEADPPAFFKAKKLEQEQRHAKHQDTPYSLEPNLKEAPGGLRDLHTIQWIARASGIGRKWSDLVAARLLERHEARQLARHEAAFQDLRIRLHYLAGRRGPHRVRLPERARRAVRRRGHARAPRGEAMMQRYYRTAKTVTQLNTIVLQNIGARRAQPEEPRALNERFRIRELLHVEDESLFARSRPDPRELPPHDAAPRAARHDRADAARAVAGAPAHRRELARPARAALFLQILQQPRGIVHEFRRMNQYGILGRYLPEFGRIVGQMQHDLFHVYTVDQHILMVLRNVRRFTMPEFAHEFPLCSELISGFERHWLIYIAALYHDIAKGRGGDHSELGSST